MMIEPRAYTVDEFCKAYSVSRSVFYRELKEGRITGRLVGTKRIVLREDADAWAATLPQTTSAARAA